MGDLAQERAHRCRLEEDGGIEGAKERLASERQVQRPHRAGRFDQDRRCLARLAQREADAAFEGAGERALKGSMQQWHGLVERRLSPVGSPGHQRGLGGCEQALRFGTVVGCQLGAP